MKEKKQAQGNLYDRIFKENAEFLFIPLVEQELGFKIKSYKSLPEKLPRTLEREMDFFYQVELEDGHEILLHLEFQSKNDKNMIYRMGEYHALAFNKYKMPIKHVVIYLGTAKASMRTKLKKEEIYDGFDLINIHQMDTTQLLASQIPEVILLALLSDFKKERTEAVLRLIISQLKSVSKTEQELSKYLSQLTILSRLRKLEDKASKIIRDMPIIYDITKDSLYQQGIEQGIEQGLEKGKEQGAEKAQKETVLRCFKQGMSIELTAMIAGVSIEKAKAIKEEMDK